MRRLHIIFPIVLLNVTRADTGRKFQMSHISPELNKRKASLIFSLYGKMPELKEKILYVLVELI